MDTQLLSSSKVTFILWRNPIVTTKPLYLQVNPNDLDNKYAHIQVTHVTPFFKEKELQRRLTDFEKNNNVREFMYETPFTKTGRARGEIDEQYKRRTVLTSKCSPVTPNNSDLCQMQSWILGFCNH